MRLNFHWLLLGLVFSLLLTACETNTQNSIKNNASPSKDSTMQAYETEEFTWDIGTSHYYLDKGATQMVTLERENWMKDAQAKVVANWFGAGNVWGKGGGPMGGDPNAPKLRK